MIVFVTTALTTVYQRTQTNVSNIYLHFITSALPCKAFLQIFSNHAHAAGMLCAA